jgi:hypothetical protein
MPVNVNGSRRPDSDSNPWPRGAHRPGGRKDVEAEDRRRQYQRQGHDRLDQELGSPSGRCQPIGERQSEEEQNARGADGQLYSYQ